MKIKFALSTGPYLTLDAEPSERLMHVVSRLIEKYPKEFESKMLNYCLVNAERANMISTLKENNISEYTTIILTLSAEEGYIKEIKDENIRKAVDSFKSQLEKMNNESEVKKLNFELKCGEPKDGISFDLYTIDTKQLFKYIDLNVNYIKNSFSVLSLQFKVQDLQAEKVLKKFYDKYEKEILKLFVEEKLFDLEINYRSVGTDIFIEITSQNGYFVKPVLTFGLDPSKLGEYSLSMGFNTMLKVSDIFSRNCEEVVSLFYLFIIYLKGESKNLSYVVDAAIEAMNTLKLTNRKFQRRLDDYLKYISLAMDLVSANTEIKATPKYVIKETTKRLEKEGFLESVKSTKSEVKDILKKISILDGISAFDVIKGIIFDSIDICYGLPNKQSGILACIRLPGTHSVIKSD